MSWWDEYSAALGSHASCLPIVARSSNDGIDLSGLKCRLKLWDMSYQSSLAHLVRDTSCIDGQIVWCSVTIGRSPV